MKFVCIALTVGCVVLAGCGKSRPSRSSLQGKVIYEGKPVVYGTITFAPDFSKGNKGVFGTAAIRNGEFQTNPGYGFTPGPVLLNVQVFDAEPPKNQMLANIHDHAVDIPSGTSSMDFQFTAKDVKPITQ